MIKNYILHNEDGTVNQFIKCHKNEIELYQSLYIEIQEDSFHFDSSYTYKVENGNVIKTERTDIDYLLKKVNKEYENTVNSITASIPQSEISTWTKQESEARAYLHDTMAQTPLIDAMCETRGCTKEYMINKIIEKADAYAVAIGRLTGIRQAKEKLITQGEE